MKKNFYPAYILSLSFLFYASPVFAAAQVVAADANCATATCADTTGSDDGVSFTANAVLTVDDDTTVGETGGLSFDNALGVAANAGTINFNTAGTTSVEGAIGQTGANQSILVVNVNTGNTMVPGGDIFAVDFDIETGGTVRLDAARTLEGSLEFVGTSTLNLQGNTLTITAGQGTGVVTTVAGTTISTTLNSSTSLGNITATGASVMADGTTVNATVAGALTSGTALTILSGAGADTATITVTDNSARYSFTGAGAAGDITITPTLVSSSSVTTSSNSNNVATVLDSIVSTSTGDMLTVQNALSVLSSASALDAAYAQMDPVANGGQIAGSFNTVNQSIGALNQHLGELRTGAPAGKSGVSTGDPWTNMGWWVKGFGNAVDQDARGGISGYDATTWGVTSGLDGEIAPDTRLGFAGGYAGTEVDNDGEPGGTDIGSILGTVYLSYDDASPWYGNGGFTFTWNEYDGTRNIAFGTISRTALADYDGAQYTGFGEIGYVWENKDIEPNVPWFITPMVGLTYSHLGIGGYTETGAGDLNLLVGDQDYDFLQSSLGVKIERPWTNSSGKWVPEAHFKWLYDFIGDEAATTATFTGGGASFSTRGVAPAQHSFNAGAGLTFYSNGNVSVSGMYDFELKEDFIGHTGQGVLRVKF